VGDYDYDYDNDKGKGNEKAFSTSSNTSSSPLQPLMTFDPEKPGYVLIPGQTHLNGASGFVGGNRMGPGVIGMAAKPGVGYNAGMRAPFVSRPGWSSIVSTKPCDDA
jgi:hypothetical protein